MRRQTISLWSIIVILSLLAVGSLSVAGGVIGYRAGESLIESRSQWKSIGPLNAAIINIRVFSSTDPVKRGYVVLLITREGKLLSSGVIQDYVQAWHWTDISNGLSWNVLPVLALGRSQEDTYILWMAYEGKEYQIDPNGQWLVVDNPIESPFINIPENYADIEQDYTKFQAWQTPPGEIRQIQAAVIGYWESPTLLVFALLKNQEGLWQLSLDTGYSPTIGQSGMAVIGASCGFISAIILISIGISIFYFRRKKSSLGRQVGKKE